MPISPLAPLVIPPTQATPAADWPDDADAFVTDQYRWTLEFNSTTIPEMNAAVSQVNDDALSAASSASDAQDAAESASLSASQALGHAEAAAESELNAQAAAAAAGAAIGLPALVGHARQPLRVLPNEQGVEFADILALVAVLELTVTLPNASGAVALDLSKGSLFDLTLTGNTTLSITNPPEFNPGETLALVVRIRQGTTARTLAWFPGISWLTVAGAAPSAPGANRIVEYVLTTSDGINWLGRKGASN